MSHPIKLIVGLGNPGARYEDTRHNAGAWMLNALAKEQHLTLKKETKFSAQVAQWAHPAHITFLAIPATFMNLSGQAVSALAHFYRLKSSEILILHDELDLPPGVARIKFAGGGGGHNGLKDIITHLRSPDFYRLRIGIGHPGHRDQVTDFVLSSPTKTEQEKIQVAIQASLDVLPHLLVGEMEKAMRELHSN